LLLLLEARESAGEIDVEARKLQAGIARNVRAALSGDERIVSGGRLRHELRGTVLPSMVSLTLTSPSSSGTSRMRTVDVLSTVFRECRGGFGRRLGSDLPSVVTVALTGLRTVRPRPHRSARPLDGRERADRRGLRGRDGGLKERSRVGSLVVGLAVAGALADASTSVKALTNATTAGLSGAGASVAMSLADEPEFAADVVSALAMTR